MNILMRKLLVILGLLGVVATSAAPPIGHGWFANPKVTGGGGGGSLFLDTYSTNTSSAVATILLRTAYTGPLIRVRESVGNVEKDFYQGATVGSLNTISGGSGQDLLAFCVAPVTNGFVSRWYQQDTNGSATLDWVQTTAGSQGMIVRLGVYVALQNGIPGVAFTNAFMTITNANAYVAPAQFHIFSVAKYTAFVNFMGIMHPDNITSGWSLAADNTANRIATIRTGTERLQASSALSINTMYLFDYSWDSSTDLLFINASSQSGAGGDSGYGSMAACLGSGYLNSTGQAWNGFIWNVIVFSKALAGNAAGARTALDTIYTGIP